MKKGYIMSVIVAFLATLGCNAQPRTINRTTVGVIDLRRYMGRWYEIARYDHSFERNLECCEAYYTLLPNGRITVTNSGVSKKSGKRKISIGKAKLGRVAGQLRVSFFWIFYSDYNILALGDDYEWALVGSRSPKYLWILSRTPHISKETKSTILNIARSRGYDIEDLIWVRQESDMKQ
jgi:lipocalin